ncbi:MAG: biotin/lipoyl-containing protein [Candidatus Delongbacteria bacterium]
MKEIKLEINGKEYTVVIEDFGSEEAKISVDGNQYNVGLKDLGEQLIVDNIRSGGSSGAPSSSDQAEKETGPASDSGPSQVAAPLPGLIVDVLVKVGDKVKVGQKIMVMEAMKMENDINATSSGIVKALNVKNGDNISEGDILAVIE